MKYIIPINEFLSNQKYGRYLVTEMERDFKSNVDWDVSNQKTFRFTQNKQTGDIKGDMCFFIPKEEKLLRKFLKKWTNKFEENNLILSTVSSSHATNGRLLQVISFYIKTEKISRVKPPKFVYHTSPVENRENILTNGLQTKTKHWTLHLTYRPSIFASMDSDNLFQNDGGKDVWIIDTTLIPNKWYLDMNINKFNFNAQYNDFIVTFEDIPTEAIQLKPEIKSQGY